MTKTPQGASMNELTREQVEQSYNRVMSLLKNTKLAHGLCNPRERRACTHCNAVDDLAVLIAEWNGPRVIQSATAALRSLDAGGKSVALRCAEICEERQSEGHDDGVGPAICAERIRAYAATLSDSLDGAGETKAVPQGEKLAEPRESEEAAPAGTAPTQSEAGKDGPHVPPMVYDPQVGKMVSTAPRFSRPTPSAQAAHTEREGVGRSLTAQEEGRIFNRALLASSTVLAMPEPALPLEMNIKFPQAELDKAETVWGAGDLDRGIQNMAMEINRLRTLSHPPAPQSGEGVPIAYLVDSATRGRFLTFYKDEAHGVSRMFRKDKVTPLFAAPKSKD